MTPSFRAAVNSATDELEVLVYDEIGEDWWSGGGITAQTVRAAIDRAGTFSRISVRINSPGGDAFEGIAIGNVLKATGKPIDVCIDGIAASAASIIAMAGSTITMANNAMMMIHNAWSMCVGYADDMEKMADTLRKISASIAKTYVDRTKNSADEIAILMDAETWMSAEECLDKGFATAIATESNEPAMAMARGFKVLAKMKKVPDSLKNSAACACACENCAASNCMNCTASDCDDKNCANCPMQAGSADNRVKTPVKADSGKTTVCECSCQSCADGTCAECSNKDCIDENCPDCPNQEEEVGASSNVSLFVARQWELEHGIRA